MPIRADLDALKQMAAHRAVEFIQSDMVVGLGHGSTAAFAVDRLAQRLAEGSLAGIEAIACSLEVEQHAKDLAIPLTTLEDHPTIDLTIDGADEVDPNLDLIKGGGGALLREKIVASVSRREIIIVDGSKLSERLGTRFALPVEVVPFAASVVARFLEQLGATVSLRTTANDQTFCTDQGNHILDCRFGPIPNARELAQQLNARPGIVAHGLFLGLATDLIVADSSGVHHRER